MNEHRFTDYIKFFTFFACFVGIPVIITFFGYNYEKRVNYEKSVKNLSSKIYNFYTKLTPFSNQQIFWIHLFNNQISKKALKGKTVRESMENIAYLFGQLSKKYDFEYLVYNPYEGMIASLSHDTLGGNERQKTLALTDCWNYHYKYDIWAKSKYTEVEEARGIVFGPQFYIAHTKHSIENETLEMNLCWTDSLYQRKPFWFGLKNNSIMMAFIHPESLKNTRCLTPFLQEATSEIGHNISFEVIDENDSEYLNSSNNRSSEVGLALKKYETNPSLKIETENYIIYPKFLRPGILVAGIVKKSDVPVGISSSLNYWLYIFSAIFIFSIVIFAFGWQVIVNKKLDRVSIKWKLCFLFFFANGLPVIVLAYIGNDFISQVSENHIQNLIKEDTGFLQDFDEKYELEFSKCIINTEKIKASVFTPERNSSMTFDDLNKFYEGISKHTDYCYFIASKTQLLVRNNHGTFNQDDLKIIEGDSSKTKYKGKRINKNTIKLIRLSEKCGRFFLEKVNNCSMNEKNLAEMELLIENLLRKNANTVVFDYLDKRGSFSKFGLGQQSKLTFTDTYSYGKHSGFDYYMILSLDKEDFIESYLNRAVPSANRNELGMRVVVWSSESGFIPSFEESDDLLELIKRLSSYPIKDEIIINHKGVDYIATGFNCKHITDYKIIGLYPLDLVKEYVGSKKRDFLWISFLCLFITLGLSVTLIRTFINPLKEITSGTQAIVQKNFDYRLPKLGRDEFGDMGKIFNEVMVDLDELSVASAMQKQLLPTSSIKTSRLDLYGKNVSMVDMGGDYFDFIEMEDNKFAIALGDVAGHGVGASLIVAMAKSALIQLDNLWKEPLKLLTRLHEMIYLAKTQKQKKIMTFQYMFVDGEQGEAIYSCAGACSPFILKKETNSVEELKLPGAVLGAFKKAKLNEINIKFAPGDAVVFYTDGIVECKNTAGEMLGYDNLKSLIKKSWNPDAETFYKNIYQSYIEYIGSEENAIDDITIIIMTFKENPTEADPKVEHRGLEPPTPTLRT